MTKIIITNKNPYSLSQRFNVGEIYDIKYETTKGFVLNQNLYKYISKKYARLCSDMNRNGANEVDSLQGANE